MTSAYPLQWPVGWNRTDAPGQSRFGRKLTVYQATNDLLFELRRLGADGVLISTNLALRADGLPRSNQRRPSDSGVAVYFELAGRDTVLACDRWDRVEHNIRAIELHVSAIRGMERWGVGTVEQVFSGYQALPPASATPVDHWSQVLGISRFATADEVRSAHRELVKEFHPDQLSGNTEVFKRVQAARDQALAEVSA